LVVEFLRDFVIRASRYLEHERTRESVGASKSVAKVAESRNAVHPVNLPSDFTHGLCGKMNECGAFSTAGIHTRRVSLGEATLLRFVRRGRRAGSTSAELKQTLRAVLGLS